MIQSINQFLSETQVHMFKYYENERREHLQLVSVAARNTNTNKFNVCVHIGKLKLLAAHSK